MVRPACRHAWFHRGCIQGQAVRDGITCFRCPLCRDRDAFLSEMLTMGIRIPFRLPSLEDGQAYAAQSERHSRCDASECLCPGGREHAEEEGPWELLLCCSCAAEGTHRWCSSLRMSTASWECDSCAGLGTASSASTELTGPRTARQSAASPTVLQHLGPAAPAPPARCHQGPPVAPRTSVQQPLQPHRAQEGCKSTLTCNIGPKIPTAGP